MMARTTQGKGRAIALIFGAACILVLSGSTALANPFSALGENIHVYLIGGMSVRYDDNIYLSKVNVQSDIVTTANAGVQLEYGGRDTANSASVMFAQNWVFYHTRSENNAKHMSFNANAEIVGARNSLSVSASVTPRSNNSRDELGFGQVVQGINYRATVYDRYSITGKTRISGGVTFAATEYRTEGYSDRASITVPVQVHYEVSPKTDLRAGYSYRATFISDNSENNTQDYTASVGVRREITPTLTGDIQLGLTKRKLTDGETGYIVPVNGNLTWVATPRMIYTAYARRDFGNSALAGTSYLQSLVGLRLGYDIADRWGAGAGIEYEVADYYNSERVDNFWKGNIDVNYSPNRFVNMSAGYVFRMNRSTIELAEFDNSQMTLRVNARY